MRPMRISSASAVIFALPPLLLSTLLSPLFLFSHAYALADDLTVDPQVNEPRSPHPVSEHDVLGELRSGYEDLVERYVPDFVGINRGIIGRAGELTQTLSNNQPGKPQDGIQGGQTQYYTVLKSTLLGPKSPSTSGLPSTLGRRNEYPERDLPSDELRKRQSQVRLYITLSTCSQPLPNNAGTNGGANQLQVYISTSVSNEKPDQSNNNYVVSVDGGFGSLSITASDNIFISVFAPKNNGFSGNYNYELTASIDDYYAMSYNQVFNRVVDTDTTSVLLYTNDTTSENSSTTVYQQWMKTRAFSVYVFNQDNTATIGIQKSWCALDTYKQAYVNSSSNDTSMTTAVDGQPKQQFHVQNLNGSSTYYAIIAIDGNSTKSGGGVVKGGGTIWAFTNFTTKSDNNCAIVYNLSFCTDVGYAVPWNPNNSNSTLNDPVALGQLYDQNASNAWRWFDNSLQQVACNTTSSAQYSLARTCTDCANAYKQWLCAVLIPRCEDFSNPASHLQPRAVTQNFVNDTLTRMFPPNATGSARSETNSTRAYMKTSRNPLIDALIMPGPYKEVLPCQQLCYHLVQSCPAILQFACPLPGFGLNYSYGVWDKTLPSGRYSCNPMALSISRAANLNGLGIVGMALICVTIFALIV